MPSVLKSPDILQRISALEEQVAMLRRTGWERDEVPFYATSYRGLVFEDNTTWSTMYETILTPRASVLALGLVFIGDQVSGTNTGGEWRVMFDDTTTAASGNVPATYSYHFPVLSIDLIPYRAASALKVQLQTRRTAGATTGGLYGAGGSIGGSLRYARLL
ncbi:hypothetical protein ACF06Q_09215 [Streptomyces leeuwenhoekii]|uniref:hypothetical protein n=1 Tax=Streptomyces leeuwenhoekii TaxID=1437453 RepID=UPI0036F53CC9